MTDFYKNYFTVAHIATPKRTVVWKVLGAYLQKRFIPQNARVLDLAAGYGVFVNNITAKEKYAMDQSAVLREHTNKDVHVLIQDCTKLDNLETDFFDVVFASNFLEHLERSEIETLLPQIHRILKPGGRIILLQPNFATMYKHYFDDYTHKQIFTDISLGDILKASDFKLETVRPKFLPASMRSRLPTAPWMIACYLYSPWKPLAGQMLVVGKK